MNRKKTDVRSGNSMMNKCLNMLAVNSSRSYLDVFVREAAASVPPGSVVLDAGAGDSPYQHHFAHAKYETADFCQSNRPYSHIDYVCELHRIPVEDNRYDLVLMTQVLEHIPDPLTVLKEMHRILKPGGSLWCSAPLYFEEHEAPYDFYRYTQFGFGHLMRTAGFQPERIEWLEGYLGTLSHQLKTAARYLPVRPKHYGGGFIGLLCAPIAAFSKAMFFLLSFMFARMDLRHKYVSSGLCKNYAAVATKHFEP